MDVRIVRDEDREATVWCAACEKEFILNKNMSGAITCPECTKTIYVIRQR